MMTRDDALAFAWMIFLSIVITFATLSLVGARDLGQWGDIDPEIAKWYRDLKQPDSGISCCGSADSYYCIEKARGSQVICEISDDRDNEALRRKPIPNGTMIEVPPNKINRDANITGHAVIFLSYGGYVWCFVGVSGS